MNDKPPSTIGEVLHLEHGVRIEGADATRFNPQAYYPAKEATEGSTPKVGDGDGDKSPPPHAFERPHPPIYLGTLPFAPAAYIVHKHAVECEHCRALHYHSQVYAHNRLRNRSGTGFIDNLSPVSAFSYNAPIVTIELKPTRVPICFECAATVSLDQLPEPPEPARIVGLGTATPDRPKPAAKAGPRVRTIDDLV